MKCNYCNTEMEEGSFRIDITALSYAAFGPSRMYLFFKRKEEAKFKDIVLKPSIEYHGFKCPGCNSLSIEGNEEVVCQNCNTKILPNEDKCPKCGWTWQTEK